VAYAAARRSAIRQTFARQDRYNEAAECKRWFLNGRKTGDPQ
jgi:hypothetical protein